MPVGKKRGEEKVPFVISLFLFHRNRENTAPFVIRHEVKTSGEAIVEKRHANDDSIANNSQQ